MADLNAARIASAALAVADDRGAGGFTMRAVADALDPRLAAQWSRRGVGRAAAASSLAIVGVAAEEGRFDEMELPDAAQLDELPNASIAFLRRRDIDAEFELVVRSLIDGLYTRLNATA